MRVAFDVGGTFTDVVVVEADGSVRAQKLVNRSRSEETAAAVRDYIQSEGDALPATIDWRHASTVASNSVIERNGPEVGLITTAGFRDTLEIRDLARPNVFDVDWQRAAPLLTRERRREIREATRVRGRTSGRRADLDEVERIVSDFRDLGVEAIALCLINAYLDAANEREVAAHLREVHPDLLLSVSHELSAEAGEYDRMSTTTVNAYLLPVIGAHLDAIVSALPSADRMLIMQSGGGVSDIATTRQRPIQMLESGPAAGIVAAAAFCRELDLPRVVALDMGGTTVKACIIEDGVAFVNDRAEVGAGSGLGAKSAASGYPVRTPCFDVAELGAGGGSIAWIDRGLLQVGPRSAGAVPGPACYDRGGTDATVTDANVTLGLLHPDALAAGTFPIKSELARGVVGSLADDLNVAPEEAAWGIRQVANATMVRAIRSVTIERGRDPRTCELLCSGGSGALHATELAAELGMNRVIVPPFAGVLSALGLLMAETTAEQTQSIRPVALPADDDDLGEAMGALGSTQQVVRASVSSGSGAAPDMNSYAFLRYGQQAEATRLPLDPRRSLLEQQCDLIEAFEREHLNEYGYRREDDSVELVRIGSRLTLGDGDVPPLKANQLAATGIVDTRQVYWGKEPGWVDTAILEGRIAIGDGPLHGPAIIEEADTSIAVPPGWSAELGEHAVVFISHRDQEGIQP